MENRKNMFYIILCVCAAVFTAAAVFAGIYCQTASEAKAELRKMTSELKTENENLKNREEILRKSLDSKQDETDEKDALNKKITEITSDTEKIKEDISSMESEISKLRSDSEKLSEKTEALSKGMNEKTLDSMRCKDETLMCPAEIEEGRYKITGEARFTITSLSNKVSTAEDLSQLETNSYIFEIEAGESITVDGSSEILLLER